MVYDVAVVSNQINIKSTHLWSTFLPAGKVRQLFSNSLSLSLLTYSVPSGLLLLLLGAERQASWE